MGRMHVADFEASAFPGQSARSERGQATLMGNFRKRVGLVHKLAELAGAEKFTHRGGRRFRIDQVMGHDRINLDRAHPLANGALHTQQANAILVFHQFPDRANPPVAKVVDIVGFPMAVLETNQRFYDFQNIFLTQDTDRILHIKIKTQVHFHPADSREIIAFRIEKQPVEKRFRCFLGRRLTRTHNPVNVDQGLIT